MTEPSPDQPSQPVGPAAGSPTDPPPDVPTAGAPAADVPATDVPAADVPAAEVPAAEVPAASVTTAAATAHVAAPAAPNPPHGYAQPGYPHPDYPASGPGSTPAVPYAWQPGPQPYPRPVQPLFAETWPGPTSAAAPVVLAAAVVAGVGAAALIPWTSPGIGWFLLALVLVAAGLTISRRAGTGPGERAGRLGRAAWAAAAVALLGVGAIHASPWLFTLCVLTAFVTGSLAVAGGRSVRGLTLGAIAVPFAALRGLGWAGRGIGRLRRATGSRAPRIAGSVLVGLVLLAVFAPLLASADAAFSRILGDALPAVDGVTVFRWIFLFGLAGIGTIGAGYVLAAPPEADGERSKRRARLSRLEWGLPVGLLVGLFGWFVAVQLTALFGGDVYVQRTTGLTYAEYARGGFWQLLTVTVLTLVVIMLTARWAAVEEPGDRAWLRALLGALAALTLVIVASALSRMWAYQQAYGFTVLRVLVTACELWLGVVYVLVIAAGVRLRNRWLPRAILGAGVAALLALAALNPERLIAEQNLQRYAETGQLDTGYLFGLSADAVPTIAALPEPLRICGLAVQAGQLDRLGVDDWRSWNAARAAARELTAGVDRAAVSSCPPAISRSD